MKPIAAVDLLTKYKNTDISEFEIVDISQENVLSGITAEALGLVMWLDALLKNKIKGHIPVRRQNKMCGLGWMIIQSGRTTGTLPDKYTIKIDPDAKGVSHPVRRQPAVLYYK